MLAGKFSKHPAKYYFYYLECMSFLQIYRGFSISLLGNTGASFNKHDAVLPLGSSDICYCRLRDFIILFINMFLYFFYTLNTVALWLLKASSKCCEHVFYKYFGQVFGGNVDRNTPVQHSLYSSIQARYLRFHPRTWQSHICMRAEVYGCQEGNLFRTISWISVASSFFNFEEASPRPSILLQTIKENTYKKTGK